MQHYGSHQKPWNFGLGERMRNTEFQILRMATIPKCISERFTSKTSKAVRSCRAYTSPFITKSCWRRTTILLNRDAIRLRRFSSRTVLCRQVVALFAKKSQQNRHTDYLHLKLGALTMFGLSTQDVYFVVVITFLFPPKQLRLFRQAKPQFFLRFDLE